MADTENLGAIELAWAEQAFLFAQQYENKLLTSSIPFRSPQFTQSDEELLAAFRMQFPELITDKVTDNDLKNSESKLKWNTFLEQFRETVEDYNAGTLLRADAAEPFSDSNCILVVRLQFYVIELDRCARGVNDRFIEKFRDSLGGKATDISAQYADEANTLLEQSLASRNFGCYHCGSTNQKLMRCSRCKVAQYCSRACQRSHWKEHKRSCKE